MTREEKNEQIAEIKGLIEESTGIFFVDYSGVDVENISNIRREFLKEGVTYKVFKNTLAVKAFENFDGFNEVKDVLQGMTGFAFAGENYVVPPKIIKKHFDDSGKFSFKGGYIESQFFPADQLDALSKLPTKEEVMASIVGSIAAPASGIVGAISAVARDIVSCVDQIAKQKEAA